MTAFIGADVPVAAASGAGPSAMTLVSMGSRDTRTSTTCCAMSRAARPAQVVALVGPNERETPCESRVACFRCARAGDDRWSGRDTLRGRSSHSASRSCRNTWTPFSMTVRELVGPGPHAPPATADGRQSGRSPGRGLGARYRAMHSGVDLSINSGRRAAVMLAGTGAAATSAVARRADGQPRLALSGQRARAGTRSGARAGADGAGGDPRPAAALYCDHVVVLHYGSVLARVHGECSRAQRFAAAFGDAVLVAAHPTHGVPVTVSPNGHARRAVESA